MLRTVLMILSGNAAGALVIMLRNLLIARMISLEDYGIASTFMLAMALVEMMSQLGLHQQIVQAKNGNDPHLQAALQGFQVLRGAMNAAVLLALGGPIAGFFGHPELAWAYRLLALIPLAQAFVHFDTHRRARQMNYLPATLTTTLPPLASLLLAWPLLVLFGDFRVMLCALLVQTLVAVAVSHLVAERAYRLTLDRGIIAGSLRFGWPLLANGVLMFLIFNGERMIVGRELGMEALAVFAVAFSLALSPTLVMAKSAMSFFLPQLSAAQDEARFRHLAMAACQAHLALGGALVVGIGLLGGPFLHLALGPRYAPAVPLLTWMAVMQGLRLMKGGASVVALARAHTGNAVAANLLRAGLLPLAWWVAATGGELRAVIWIGIAGEAAGLAVGLALAMGRVALPWRPLALPLLAVAGLLAGAAIHAHGQGRAEDWSPDPLTGALLLALFALSLVPMRDLRRYVRNRQLLRHDD